MTQPTYPNILTEDTVRQGKLKLTSEYNPEHLLQWAHNANFQMSLDVKHHPREWQAMLQDGKDGKEAKFKVYTPWNDPSDCMDLLIATIYYHPNTPDDDGNVFFITEQFYAIGVSGPYRVESPLFHFRTEQQLFDYLDDKETPFKRYLHLEHIMEQMRNSERGQQYARQLKQQQEEKEQQETLAQQPQESNSSISAEDLYRQLTQEEYSQYPYELEDYDEGMAVLKESMWGWWKPRYLLDHIAHKAYLFMGENKILTTVTDEDIDWDSLKNLPEKYIERAKAHSGHFPTLLGAFHKGEAEVEWQINPDGRYYEDEDGFGMTDDEEITLHGSINRTGHVIRKFRFNG